MMKNFFILLFCWAVSAQVMAQGIRRDNTDISGKRTIITDEEEYYEDETVGLTYIITSAKDTTRVLNITIEDWGRLEEGRLLLLKFDDGSIMELKNCVNQIAHPVAGHNGGIFPAVCLEPQYLLTREQLETICNKHVVKLRFEQGDGNLDRNIKKNRFSTIVSNCVNAISRAVPAKKDVYEDF